MTNPSKKHPLTLCLNDLHYIFSGIHPDGSYTAPRFRKDPLYVRLGITSRHDFARAILPEDIFLLLESSWTSEEVLDLSGKSREDALRTGGNTRRSTLNRSFKNEGKKNGSKERFSQVVSLLTSQTSRTPDTYETSRYQKQCIVKWQKLLCQLEDNETQHVASRTDELLQSIPKESSHSDLRERLQLASKVGLERLLSCLTLVACTLYIWNKPDLSDRELFAQDIILPALQDENGPVLLSRQRLEGNANEARKKLERIHSSIESIEDIDTDTQSAQLCHRVCLEILSHLIDDDAVLGEVYYILYKCCKSRSFSAPDRTKAYDYLKESRARGWGPALKEENPFVPKPLYPVIPRSKDNRPGLCVTNATGLDFPLAPKDLSRRGYAATEVFGGRPQIRTILDSAPENWRWELLGGEYCTDPGTPVKYFLFHESWERDFNNLLGILNYYKQYWKKNEQTDVEIYFLGDSELLGSLVDTAQQIMSDFIVPIHIINEEKRSAQFLLAEHPLFHTVREHPTVPRQQEPTNLHFVILGTDSCAEHLLREASWMMTFSECSIFPKITLVGPDAPETLERIRSKCPGYQSLPDDADEGSSSKKDKDADKKDILVNYPSTYEYDLAAIKTEDLNTLAFDQFLYERLRSNEALCFAVSMEDSAKSLAAAIALREKMIRFYIAVHQEKDSGFAPAIRHMPPIAFRCKDYRTAELARNLVVSKVDHGNDWFNNHMLIPYGTYSDLYSWDGLVENPIERLSQCVHLVYAGVELPASAAILTPDEKIAFLTTVRKQLADYYKRQYNKDSSFSVALSLPYRLFHCTKHRNRILSGISVMEKSSCFDFNQLANLSKSIQDLLENDREGRNIKRIAKWEHDRWCRWMIANGWLPATPEQASLYRSTAPDGNPMNERQLYIGKLHPAICGWSELESVEKALENEYRKYDISSAEKTAEILHGALVLHEIELTSLQLELQAELQTEIEPL